jgi:hypothetical protein
MPEMFAGTLWKELDLMRLREHRVRIVSWKSCDRFISFPSAHWPTSRPRSELHQLLSFSVLNKCWSPDVSPRTFGGTLRGDRTMLGRSESAKLRKRANK